jgi:hypothetical protein
VVGRAGDGVEAFDLTDALQSATLRYSAARQGLNQKQQPVTAEYAEYAENCDLVSDEKSSPDEWILTDTGRLKTCATCVATQLVSAEADHARG